MLAPPARLRRALNSAAPMPALIAVPSPTSAATTASPPPPAPAMDYSTTATPSRPAMEQGWAHFLAKKFIHTYTYIYNIYTSLYMKKIQ